MAYIGKSPQVGNFVKLDAISTSSTNSYDLLNGGVAFTPESANHMIVSLNGVIQAPSTAFSVSGSTITFLPSSGTLSSADTIDFILVLGNVLDIGTPSDSTVTNAKTNFVSTSSNAGLSIKGDGTSSGTGGQLQLNCSNNNHGIKLESPAHSAGQSYTLKFPTGNVTAGKVLKVDSVSGSGTTGIGQLSFGDGGNVEIIANNTTGGTAQELEFDLSMDTDYIFQRFLIENLYSSASNDLYALTRRASDNTYFTGSNSYAYAYSYASSSGSGGGGSSGQTYGRLSGHGMGDSSNETSQYQIDVFNNALSSTGKYTTLRWQRSGWETTPKFVHESGSLIEQATTTTNRFKIYSSAGGSSTLTYTGYVHLGIKRS